MGYEGDFWPNRVIYRETCIGTKEPVLSEALRQGCSATLVRSAMTGTSRLGGPHGLGGGKCDRYVLAPRDRGGVLQHELRLVSRATVPRRASMSNGLVSVAEAFSSSAIARASRAPERTMTWIASRP